MKRFGLTAVFALLLAEFCCVAAEFDASQLKWNLGKNQTIEKKDGKTFLKITGEGTLCATADFDLKPYMGKMLELYIPVRGKDLKKSGTSRWGAPKFMMKFNNVMDETVWPGADIPSGTFDWKKATLKINQFKGTGTLYLGFQDFSGEIEFELSGMELKTSEIPSSVKLLVPVRPDVMLEGGTPLKGLDFQLTPGAKIEGNILTVSVPADHSADKQTVSAKIDLAPYVGKVVQVSILARGKDVSTPKDPWNGVRLGLKTSNFAGKEETGVARNTPSGDFEWKMISAEAQAGTDAGSVILGLCNVSGTVEFDLDSLNIRPLYSKGNADYKAVYDARLAGEPQRRGVMLPQGDMKADDLKTLGDWNVNLVRFQICRFWMQPYTDRDLEDYDKWFESRFQNLKWLVSEAGKYGIRVVVDMHTPPGGRKANKDMNVFSEAVYANHFIQLWKKIAAEFKGNPNIWAYDLVNEPQARLKNGFDWWKLQMITAEAIRKIDPDTPIVVATNWGNGTWCWDEQKPFEMKNIIYQVHMYNPLEYTHQLKPRQNKLKAYPGKFGDKAEYWDKEKLRETLKDVRAFQLKHNARIYAGEFSAVAWAPGAEKYLKDCIEIFEEYGWDWSYHSFRESPCWDVEKEGSDWDMKPAENTPRKQVLLEAFRKNVKKTQ